LETLDERPPLHNPRLAPHRNLDRPRPLRRQRDFFRQALTTLAVGLARPQLADYPIAKAEYPCDF
jgi:hypothetical protein